MELSGTVISRRMTATIRNTAIATAPYDPAPDVVRTIMRSMRKLEECSERGVSPPEAVFSFIATMDRVLTSAECLYVAVVFATAKQERPALAGLIANATGLTHAAALTALFGYLSDTNKDSFVESATPSSGDAAMRFLAGMRRSILTKLAPHSISP